MHGLEEIIAMNNGRIEPVSDEDLDEIIEAWDDAEQQVFASWIDQRIRAMALELKWRRAEMRGMHKWRTKQKGV